MLWIEKLLSKLVNTRVSDFSGLGIVFYNPPMNIPAHSMGGLLPSGVHLPNSDFEEIVKCLVESSSYQSDWHDGFHLIDSDAQSLTHMCQFLSPSAQLISPPAEGALPVGSRYFTAKSVSKMSSVLCCAVINSQGLVNIFKDGEVKAWKI
jgi:DNA integrity scanning protein DisA with diadenylate cyclase activity